MRARSQARVLLNPWLRSWPPSTRLRINRQPPSMAVLLHLLRALLRRGHQHQSPHLDPAAEGSRDISQAHLRTQRRRDRLAHRLASLHARAPLLPLPPLLSLLHPALQHFLLPHPRRRLCPHINKSTCPGKHKNTNRPPPRLRLLLRAPSERRQRRYLAPRRRRLWSPPWCRTSPARTSPSHPTATGLRYPPQLPSPPLCYLKSAEVQESERCSPADKDHSDVQPELPISTRQRGSQSALAHLSKFRHGEPEKGR